MIFSLRNKNLGLIGNDYIAVDSKYHSMIIFLRIWVWMYSMQEICLLKIMGSPEQLQIAAVTRVCIDLNTYA